MSVGINCGLIARPEVRSQGGAKNPMIQKSEFSDDLEFLDKKYSERERQLLSAESSADLQYFVSFWWAWVGRARRAKERNHVTSNRPMDIPNRPTTATFYISCQFCTKFCSQFSYFLSLLRYADKRMGFAKQLIFYTDRLPHPTNVVLILRQFGFFSFSF